jgi:integrase
MATLEKRNEWYRVVFCYGGRKFQRSLQTQSERAASASLARLEDNLRRLSLGTLAVPEGTDIASFLLSDGQQVKKPIAQKTLTLKELFALFFANILENSLEPETIQGMRIHERQLLKRLGARFHIQELTFADLQDYVHIRMLCDYLVIGQILPMSPAASVRGPKHVVKRGKTPALTPDQAKLLIDSIDATTIIGIRDRALIATMIYSFARVSAVLGMNVDDYYAAGKRWWIRLHEKGGKFLEVPAHHRLNEHLDAYFTAAAGVGDRHSPLFRSVDRHGHLTDRRLSRNEALGMIKRRARGLPLPDGTCCHSFRATGITAYLLNGGTLEHAQRIAAHESPRTTKLYDRTSDEITLDEIERILI